MLININKSNQVINKYVDDKEIYSTKIVYDLPSDINEYQYSYINGELVRGQQIDFKKLKLQELETFINDYRNNGIEWNGQIWAIDKTCEENLTSQITYLSFAPTESVSWFSKSQVNVLTIDEFKELALILSSAIANAKMKYYTYKNAIENASSKEELDAIVFEHENTQDNIQE